MNATDPFILCQARRNSKGETMITMTTTTIMTTTQTTTIRMITTTSDSDKAVDDDKDLDKTIIMTRR